MVLETSTETAPEFFPEFDAVFVAVFAAEKLAPDPEGPEGPVTPFLRPMVLPSFSFSSISLSYDCVYRRGVVVVVLGVVVVVVAVEGALAGGGFNGTAVSM